MGRPFLIGGMVLAAATGPVVSPGAAAQEFVVDPSSDRLVTFVSETTLEAFNGTTDRVDGFVFFGPGMTAADLSPGATLREGSLYFEVDLASIDTGIGLRNRHMREDYLETDEFPFATFEGAIAAVGAHPEGGLRITSPGTFTVHGVERTRTIDCQVEAMGPGFDVDCAFTVSLDDHDIDIPSVMFLKLAEEVRVELSFRVLPAGDLQ